jgi:hypothetical protein
VDLSQDDINAFDEIQQRISQSQSSPTARPTRRARATMDALVDKENGVRGSTSPSKGRFAFSSQSVLETDAENPFKVSTNNNSASMFLLMLESYSQTLIQVTTRRTQYRARTLPSNASPRIRQALLNPHLYLLSRSLSPRPYLNSNPNPNHGLHHLKSRPKETTQHGLNPYLRPYLSPRCSPHCSQQPLRSLIQ